jgi:hypothetical protein
MEVRIAFKEKYGASLKNTYEAVMEISKLIQKINEIDYRYRQLKIKTLILAIINLIPRILIPYPRYLARLIGRIAGLLN